MRNYLLKLGSLLLLKKGFSMRGNLLVLFLLFGLLPFFSCEGQVVIPGDINQRPDGPPEYGFETDCDELEIRNDSLIHVLQFHKAEVEQLSQKVADKDQQVKSLNLVVVDLNKKLEAKPDTITDTIYQDKIVEVVPPPFVDTLTTVSDPILLDFTDSLVQPSDVANVYVMVTGIGLVHLQEMDTVYRFQRHYEIERTIDYASTDPHRAVTYRNLGLPFQIRNAFVLSKTNVSATVRVFATDQCKIQYAVNGKINAASSDQFNASKQGDIEFRHTRTINGLDPATTYNLQIVVTSESGALDVWDLKFTTDE